MRIHLWAKRHNSPWLMGRDNQTISKHLSIDRESVAKYRCLHHTQHSSVATALFAAQLLFFLWTPDGSVPQGSILGTSLCFSTRTLSLTVPSSSRASTVTSWSRHLKPITSCHTSQLYRLQSPFSAVHKQTILNPEKWKSLSHFQLFATPCTVAGQASLSMGFSRQEYWSGLPFPPQGNLPNPWIKLHLLHWQANYLPLSTPQLIRIFNALMFTVNFHRSLSLKKDI